MPLKQSLSPRQRCWLVKRLLSVGSTVPPMLNQSTLLCGQHWYAICKGEFSCDNLELRSRKINRNFIETHTDNCFMRAMAVYWYINYYIDGNVYIPCWLPESVSNRCKFIGPAYIYQHFHVKCIRDFVLNLNFEAGQKTMLWLDHVKIKCTVYSSMDISFHIMLEGYRRVNLNSVFNPIQWMAYKHHPASDTDIKTTVKPLI